MTDESPPRPNFAAVFAAKPLPPSPSAASSTDPELKPRPDLGAMLAARGPTQEKGRISNLGGGAPSGTDGGSPMPMPPPPRGPDLGAMLMASKGGGKVLGGKGGKGGLPGGVGGLFGGGGGFAKKKKPVEAPPRPVGEGVPAPGEARDQTPTERLRVLDGLRMHVPLAEERERLKLPGGDRDRVPVGPDPKVRLPGPQRVKRMARQAEECPEKHFILLQETSDAHFVVRFLFQQSPSPGSLVAHMHVLWGATMVFPAGDRCCSSFVGRRAVFASPLASSLSSAR